MYVVVIITVIIIINSICLTGPLFHGDHKLGLVPERSPPGNAHFARCIWPLAVF